MILSDRMAAKEKLTLILLPGLLCDGAIWKHQENNLRDLVDIRVADFRGLESIRAMADSVIRDAPPRFAIAGHSMGGRVALEVANIVGERVSHLILLDTDVQPRAPGEEQRRQVSLEFAEQQGMAEFARHWVRPLLATERQGDELLLSRLIAMVERFSIGDYKAQLKALLYRPDASAYLQDIFCPTLLICGRNGGPRTVERHELIAACLGRANLVVIESCGHMTPIERPVAVTEAIRNLLLSNMQEK